MTAGTPAPTDIAGYAPKASTAPLRAILSCAAKRAVPTMSATSPPASVGLIRRAKAEGVNITCETAPHYLVLDENALREDGRFKMNPPALRRRPRGTAGGTAGRHDRHDRHRPCAAYRRRKEPGAGRQCLRRGGTGNGISRAVYTPGADGHPVPGASAGTDGMGAAAASVCRATRNRSGCRSGICPPPARQTRRNFSAWDAPRPSRAMCCTASTA